MESSAADANAGDGANPAIGAPYFKTFGFKTIGFARAVGGLLAGLCLLLAIAPSHAATETKPSSPAAPVETRRAFLVGIQRYSDGYIQRLERAANDAKDLAKDLEEVGFDKKNIKVAVDLRDRDAFEKEFSAFLNTIQPGDDVVFYFSGHGFGDRGGSDQLSFVCRSQKSVHLHEVAADRPGPQQTLMWCGCGFPNISTHIRQMKFPKAFRQTRSNAASPRKIPRSSS